MPYVRVLEAVYPNGRATGGRLVKTPARSVGLQAAADHHHVLAGPLGAQQVAVGHLCALDALDGRHDRMVASSQDDLVGSKGHDLVGRRVRAETRWRSTGAGSRPTAPDVTPAGHPVEKPVHAPRKPKLHSGDVKRIGDA